MDTKHYEFTEHENLVIKKLFSHMNFVGISLIVLGGLFGIFGLYLIITGQSLTKEVLVLVISLVIIIMGAITLKSANSFRRIIKSEGDDMEHLIKALDKLITWFSVVTTLILVSAGIVILAFIAYLSM